MTGRARSTGLEILRRRLRARARTRAAALVLLGVGGLALAAAAADFYGAVNVAPALTLRPAEIPDEDGDGVPDVYENALLGTDPQKPAAADALPERWLARFGLDAGDPELASRHVPVGGDAPPRPDTHCGPVDTVTLGELYAYGRPPSWSEPRDGAWDSGLDPRSFDHAGSGVPVAWLIARGLNPKTVELDVVAHGVSWTPREAWQRGLHPTRLDGDVDGLPDVEEQALGGCPALFSTSGTGIADGWLHAHGFLLDDAAIAAQDHDRDGLTAKEEFEASRARLGDRALTGAGLDPRATSTLGGPIPDGWFVRHGLDPLEADLAARVTQTATLPGAARRVLTVLDEYRVNRPPRWSEATDGPWWGGTDPTRADTDGDGLDDLVEILGWNFTLDGRTRLARSDPTRLDSDGDGLSDAAERTGREGFPPTDPQAPDTDFDGLLDGEETGAAISTFGPLPRTDPTVADTDGDGLVDGEEAARWLAFSKDCAAGAISPWGAEPRRPIAAVAGRACEALAPGGDVDGDGRANLVDDDSDGDGLLDGWEMRPALYAASPFASEEPRRATDPASKDTDGDGLPDGWEIRYGVWSLEASGWNLDPSRWSSFGDDVSDGERDLDDDGITWFAFVRRNGGLVAVEHAFVATNAIEFEAGSDPNRKSSSPDDVPDGWKIFWGTTYLGLLAEERGEIYPGAPGPLQLPADRPPPSIGRDDRRPATTLEYRRWTSPASPPIARETLIATSGGARSFVEGSFVFDLAAIVQHRTQPYLDDTDGDTLPDAWEAHWSRLASTSSRVNPVEPDANVDLDGDGLDARLEYDHATDPYAADSDAGGADDLVETSLGLDPLDPADDVRAIESTADADGDGLSDVAEITARARSDGRRFHTNPLDPDTDGDGLLDGESLSKRLGRRLNLNNAADRDLADAFARRGLVILTASDGTADVPGEILYGSDPTRLSTPGDAVPDGWAVLAGLSPTEPKTVAGRYAHGRPAWWNETAHGLWRWGLDPRGTGPAPRDLDQDGLDDFNGEDPRPFASQSNRPPALDPRDASLTPFERRIAGQAWGDAPGTPRALIPPRGATSLALDPVPSPVIADGTSTFTGRLVDAAGVGVPDVAVVLALGSRATAIGSAVTLPDGRFSGSILLGEQLQAPPESAGVVVFGQTDGTGIHLNEAASLASLDPGRPLPIFAWSLNTSIHSPDRQRRATETEGVHAGYRGAVSNVAEARFVLPTTVRLEVPPRASAGDRFAVEVVLVDALARPVPSEVVSFMPGPLSVVTGPDGRARATLDAPSTGGPFTVTAAWPGRDPGWLAASAEATVLVEIPTRLTVVEPPVGARPGDRVLVSGALSTSTGAAVAGARIAIEPGLVVATTGDDGRFRAVVAVPQDTPAGTILVRARFAGSETLSAGEAVAEVRVVRAARWLVEDVRSTPDRLEIRATLVDVVGRPLSQRQTRLLDGEGSVLATGRTDPEARILFGVDPGRLALGEQTLILEGDDARRGDARASVPVVVTIPTVLSVDVPELVRGRGATLAGRLVDGRGDPVPGQLLTLEMGSWIARAVTDASGRVAVHWDRPAFPVGDHVLRAHYAGTDGIRLASTVEERLSVREGLVLALGSETLVANRPEIAGRFETLAGEPARGLEFKISGPGGGIVARTKQDGSFVASYPLPRDLPLGPLELGFSVPSRDGLEPFAEKKTFLVKTEARLTLGQDRFAGSPGDRIEVPWTLEDVLGRPIDARLVASVAERDLSANILDNLLRFTIPADFRPGLHDVVVHVDAPLVEAQPSRFALDVRAPTRVRIESAPAIEPGRAGAVRVLLEGPGGALGNREVFLLGAGPVAISARTDAEGAVEIPVPAGGATDRSFGIVFEGEEGHGASAATFTVATKVPEPAPEAGGRLLAAGLVTAAALAYALARRARRTKGTADVLERVARRLASNRADVRALYDAYLDLLEALRLNESELETATFRDVLAKAVGTTRDASDVETVARGFEVAIYAPDHLTNNVLSETSAAASRLAQNLRAVGGP